MVDEFLGNVSCTQRVGHHQVSTILRQFYLQDMDGKKIKKLQYQDLVDLTDEDATVLEHKPEEDGKVLTFNLIDTPGLDDSGGDDMEIMAKIAGEMGQLSHLNAIVYVRNMNKPFSASFSRFYSYIQRSMPNLSNGLIIVHSGFTVEKVDEALRKKRDLARERKEAFKKATKSTFDLAHFFMDNDPDEYSPFAVVESLNECYKLLKLLSTQLPLDTAHIRLLKTPSMDQVDIHIVLILTQLHGRLKSAWTDELAKVSKNKAAALRLSRQIDHLQNKLEEYEAERGELDTNSQINLGTQYYSVDYGLKNLLFKGELWLDEKNVSFSSDYRITDVEKSATGGSKWLDEDLCGNSWRGTLTASMFRSINGSATFYTTMKIKHAGAIAALKRHIEDTKLQKGFLEDQLRAGGDGEDLQDRKAVGFGRDAERCEKTIERIKKESFEIVLWPLLKRFYVDLERAKPTRKGIVEFVRVYDEGVAEALQKEFWE